MQRHVTATIHTLLVLGTFVASVVPVTAQTSTVIEREVREELRRDRDLRRLDVTVVGDEVTLRAIKDHENEDLQDLHVGLDPRTLLLVRN